MNLVDRSFPLPLMNPEAWPEPEMGRQDLWLLPLEFTVATGGRWRAYVDRVCKTGAFAWRLSAGWERLETDQILFNEVRRWLLDDRQAERIYVDTSLGEMDLAARWTEFWGTELSDLTEADIGGESKLCATPAAHLMFRGRCRIKNARREEEGVHLVHRRRSNEAVLILQRPLNTGLQRWAEEIFSSLRLLIGPEAFAKLVAEYSAEWEEAHRLPWDGLRYFPAFLRQRRGLEPRVVELAALDWARFQTVYSPQDESRDRESLMPEELLLNPTLQLIRVQHGEPPEKQSEKQSEMRAICRFSRSGRAFEERVLHWREAVLMDELLESPRTTKTALLAHAEDEYGAPEKWPERWPKGESTSSSFLDALNALLRSGFILSHEGN